MYVAGAEEGSLKGVNSVFVSACANVFRDLTLAQSKPYPDNAARTEILWFFVRLEHEYASFSEDELYRFSDVSLDPHVRTRHASVSLAEAQLPSLARPDERGSGRAPTTPKRQQLVQQHNDMPKRQHALLVAATQPDAKQLDPSRRASVAQMLLPHGSALSAHAPRKAKYVKVAWDEACELMETSGLDGSKFAAPTHERQEVERVLAKYGVSCEHVLSELAGPILIADAKNAGTNEFVIRVGVGVCMCG